jgi:flavin-dependent dehydrogenase
VEIHDVALLGAGFVGVTTARELATGGLSVLLVEARDRIGRAHLEVSRYGIEVTRPEPLSLPKAWLVGGRLVESGSPIPLEELGDRERLLQTLTRLPSA